MHRERLRDDPAVLHNERVGTEGNVAFHAPGNEGNRAVDPKASEFEAIYRAWRHGVQELGEEPVYLWSSDEDLVLGIKPCPFAIVAYDGAYPLALQERSQVLAHYAFCLA